MLSYLGKYLRSTMPAFAPQKVTAIAIGETGSGKSQLLCLYDDDVTPNGRQSIEASSA